MLLTQHLQTYNRAKVILDRDSNANIECNLSVRGFKFLSGIRLFSKEKNSHRKI